MKERRNAGIWISLILGLYGIIGSFYVFVVNDHWREMWDAKAGQYSASLGINRVDEAFIVQYVIPALHDLAIIGSAMMIVAAWLFYKKHSKAWHVGVIGSVLAVQGTGFPIVAGASAGIFPEYVFVFTPIFIGFYLYIAYIRNLTPRVILWATVIGMTYVLALFNGIASASRMSQMEAIQAATVGAYGIAENTPMFGAVQQINWIGMIGWGFVLVGLLFQKKWIIPVGIFSAILNIIGGMPLGIESMSSGTTFSMFLIAPIFALIILIYFVSPSGQRFVEDWADNKQYHFSEGRDLNV